jgi:hypothetical protein
MSLEAQGIVGIGPNLGYAGTQSIPTPTGFEPPRVGAIVTGAAGVGSGDNYRPAPGLPPAKHLDYFNKLFQALAVVVLAVYLVRDPGKAFRALERRAGVR